MPHKEGEQVCFCGGTVRLKLALGKFVVRVPRNLVADGRDKEMVVDRIFNGKEDMARSYAGCLDKILAVVGQ